MSSAHTANAQMVDVCEAFLRNYYREEILQLCEKYPSDQSALYIDWSDAYNCDPHFAQDILEKPTKMKEYLEEALALFDVPVDVDLSGAEVRITDLPPDQTFHVGEYGTNHIAQQICVQGQVSQISQSEPKLQDGVFVCQRCGTPTRVPQPDNSREEPHECEGCERQGPFLLDEEESEFVSQQAVRLQRPPEKGGSGREKLDVYLQGDLADGVLTGHERVRITGQLTLNDREANEDGTYPPYLAADSITIEEGAHTETDIEEFRSEITEIENSDDPIEEQVDSFAPHLELTDELRRIIKAIILQLHGAPRTGPYRGQFHQLLLGDPGAAKSELLEVARTIAPRSKKSSGKSLSEAGVTAATVRDDFGPGEWTVKPGLLVLANEGVACLDEIDKVGSEVLEATHEALETQRVSIMKAGIEADLPARTTLLAAGNPKYGRFNDYEPIAEQIDLPPSLMSRFDLMFMIRDKPDMEKDYKISGTVIDSWCESAEKEYGKDNDGDHDLDDLREIESDVFSAYIADSRENVFPQIKSESVRERIREEYVQIRAEGADEDSPVPITPRKIEAFIRLAVSAARARHSEVVEEKDVELAVELIRTSLEDVGIDPETGEFDADVIETGMSKSQRDRIKTLKQLIEDIEEDYDDGAPHDVIIERADEVNIDESSADHEIEKLKQKGEIYENGTDSYRTT